jgi:3'(2'), 5'-bisphosphate nucleotidase
MQSANLLELRLSSMQLVRETERARSYVLRRGVDRTEAPMTERQDALSKLLDAAAAAAKVVMRIYGEADLGVEMKGPNDPVTRADKEANVLLLELLSRDFGCPIVAEESPPSTYAGFGDAPYALFVDPLDGTRDFIARTGEFAVMIGLAERGRATVGVVHCPALGKIYAAAEGVGAFLLGADGRRPIHVSSMTELSAARGAISRFHRNESMDAKLTGLGLRELVPMGSAGIKAARVASAELDIYAHPSRGLMKLWDVCAPEAIVRAAGGVFTDGTGRAFDYRGPYAQNEGTLAANARLHAEALRVLRSEHRTSDAWTHGHAR